MRLGFLFDRDSSIVHAYGLDSDILFSFHFLPSVFSQACEPQPWGQPALVFSLFFFFPLLSHSQQHLYMWIQQVTLRRQYPIAICAPGSVAKFVAFMAAHHQSKHLCGHKANLLFASVIHSLLICLRIFQAFSATKNDSLLHLWAFSYEGRSFQMAVNYLTFFSFSAKLKRRFSGDVKGKLTRTLSARLRDMGNLKQWVTETDLSAGVSHIQTSHRHSALPFSGTGRWREEGREGAKGLPANQSARHLCGGATKQKYNLQRVAFMPLQKSEAWGGFAKNRHPGCCWCCCCRFPDRHRGTVKNVPTAHLWQCSKG